MRQQPQITPGLACRQVPAVWDKRSKQGYFETEAGMVEAEHPALFPRSPRSKRSAGAQHGRALLRQDLTPGLTFFTPAYFNVFENVLIGPGVSSSRCPQGCRDRSSAGESVGICQSQALLLRIFLAKPAEGAVPREPGTRGTATPKGLPSGQSPAGQWQQLPAQAQQLLPPRMTFPILSPPLAAIG